MKGFKRSWQQDPSDLAQVGDPPAALCSFVCLGVLGCVVFARFFSVKSSYRRTRRSDSDGEVKATRLEV